MKKNFSILFLIGILLSGCLVNGSWANHTALIGGVRDGLSMGMRIEEHLSDRLMYRFGIEGSTGEDLTFLGDNPLILAGGLKFRIMDIGKNRPTWFSLGLVGYSGNDSQIGIALSLIVDRVFDSDPLFFEIGADFLRQGHLQVQFGYRIMTEPAEFLH